MSQSEVTAPVADGAPSGWSAGDPVARAGAGEALVTAAKAEDREAAEALLRPYRVEATETLRGRADPITIWTGD